MIKKLLTAVSVFFLGSTLTHAQVNQLVGETTPPVSRNNMPMQISNPDYAKTATVGTNDTLWYFLNKHYYRNNPAVGYTTVKSPYQAVGVSLSEMASAFVNTSTVTVKGAYVLLSRNSVSTSTAVPVKVFLYNVDATNKPTTKIDSGLAVVTGTAGTIAGAMFTQPRTLTTNFAIAYANASTLTTDTIRSWMNNAYAPTSTVTPALRYGEALSHIKINGTYTPMAGIFGTGTDKEFVTIPMVSFSLTANAMPTTSAPYCPLVDITIANSSTSLFENPQFNLNKFLVRWPAAISASLVPVADSIYTGNFGDGSPLTYAKNPVHQYAAAGNYTASLTAKYQLGADNGQKVQDVTGGVLFVDVCTGINELESNEFAVFPNPSTGLVTVKNISVNSTIELMNVLGVVVFKEKATTETKTFDFTALPTGNYYLKLTSSDGKSSVKKLQIH